MERQPTQISSPLFLGSSLYWTFLSPHKELSTNNQANLIVSITMGFLATLKDIVICNCLKKAEEEEEKPAEEGGEAKAEADAPAADAEKEEE